MLINFSGNVFKQFFGIVFHNRRNIFIFLILGSIAYVCKHQMGWDELVLPMVPISILGGALAIFLGFRNSSAYDRWWEARKIWGGVVNKSRSFTMLILSFASPIHSNNERTQEEIEAWKKEMIYRHLAWNKALKMHMLNRDGWDELRKFISDEEVDELKTKKNKATHILNTQGARLADGYAEKIIEDFRHMELTNVLKDLYDLQGRSERIKGTVFPYYYNYFTRVFLWMFAFTLPFGLIGTMGWGAIPMNIAISFIFFILEKSGSITEDPFENRAADIPINTITRNIEIDLRQMLGETDVPEPLPLSGGRFGIKYQS